MVPEFLVFLFILLAIVAAFLLRRAGRAQQGESGLPIEAQVVSSDTGGWEQMVKPLYSARYRLTGKPDYVVREGKAIVPVEVKPNRPDTQPRDSDIMQLVAYGVLLREQSGQAPGYGLLKYRGNVFRVEFTAELEAEFFATLERMRQDRKAVEVERNHDEPTRCRYCGYREACDERLE